MHSRRYFHDNFYSLWFYMLAILQTITITDFVEFSEQLLCASFPSVTVAGSKYFTSKREMVITEAVFF